MSVALGRFSAIVDECVHHYDNVRGRFNDHLGASPDDVTWSHVADASRALKYLRLAAHAAGVGSEPEAYPD